MITFLLVIIGSLNWLLVGAVGWDVGHYLFGSMDAPISRIIYILVGLSGAYMLLTHKQEYKMCK